VCYSGTGLFCESVAHTSSFASHSRFSLAMLRTLATAALLVGPAFAFMPGSTVTRQSIAMSAQEVRCSRRSALVGL
jgi:hypothetical protein